MKKSNVQKGKSLEVYVEKLYQNLGFITRRNVNLFGQQIDVEAKKYIDGVGEIVILIECKSLQKGSVSNQTVQDFVATIAAIRTKLEITKGVLISDKEFSTDSKQLSSSNIELISLRDLEKQVLNIDSIYIELKKEYEKREIYIEYVPLSGNSIKKHGNDISNIEEWIVSKIAFSSMTISFLGDYGSGKTTIMQRLFYKFICMYLKNEIDRKPVYMELKNFYKFSNINQFVFSTFYRLYRKEVPEDLIRDEIAQGKIIFLLDGVDEMNSQFNQEVRFANFRNLEPILSSNCSTFLSCRPSYFVSKKEYENYIESIQDKNVSINILHGSEKVSTKKNYEEINKMYRGLYKLYLTPTTTNAEIKEIFTINIRELSEIQIDSFLEKFNSDFLEKCKSNWKEVKEFLLKIYDLSELMSKPLLLRMIKDTILHQREKYKENNAVEFTPSSLYEIYTTINLDVDWGKGDIRHFLTKSQRSRYAELIAIKMFEKKLLEVTYEELREIVQSNKVSLEQLKTDTASVLIEDVVSDIQICAFITRTEDDGFKFVHKSFMEFFIGRHIKDTLVNNETHKDFENVLIPKEILYFLGSYGIIDSVLKNKIQRRLNKSVNEIHKRNLIVTYLFTSFSHTDLNVNNVVIDDISLRKITFNKSRLKKMQFDRNIWDRVTFTDCHCNFEIRHTIINNLVAQGLIGSISFFDTKIHDSSFVSDEKKLAISVHSESSFLNSKISHSILQFNTLNVTKCDFLSTDIVAFNPYSNSNFLKISDCNFKLCTFMGAFINYRKDDDKNFTYCCGVCYTEVSTDDLAYSMYGFDKRGFLQIQDLLVVNLFRYKGHYSLVKKIILENYKMRV